MGAKAGRPKDVECFGDKNSINPSKASGLFLGKCKKSANTVRTQQALSSLKIIVTY
jgi:hypothetical protein